MKSLSRIDCEALLAALDNVYGARRGDDFRASILTALSALIPCDMASFNIIDPERGRARTVSLPGSAVARPGMLAVVERRFMEHPVVAYFVRTGDVRSLRLSEFVSRREFHHTALYAELYRLLGIEFQMMTPLVLQPSRAVGVVVSRRDADFSERERELLDLLRPHLSRAYEIVQVKELRDTFEQAAASDPSAGGEKTELTAREQGVLAWACQGETNAGIAEALGVSALTVKKHLEHIYGKLGVHTRAAAVARLLGDWRASADGPNLPRLWITRVPQSTNANALEQPQPDAAAASGEQEADLAPQARLVRIASAREADATVRPASRAPQAVSGHPGVRRERFRDKDQP